jgi:plastocyanin
LILKIRKEINRGGLICLIFFLCIVGMGSLIVSVASATVTVVNMTSQHQFSPREISVTAGATVQWMNIDSTAHTATADSADPISGGPNSDILFPNGVSQGQTYSWTVPASAVPGTTWFYYCRFHGNPGNGQSLGLGMTGSITVKASSIPVGAAPGRVQVSVAANQVVQLEINSTNSHGDTPVYKWFFFTAVISGNAIPLYLISDIGVFNLTQVLSNLSAYTFTFDNSGVTSIATLSMSDLGLKAGDVFIYAYAYMNQSAVYVIDNIVVITVI